jgi:hypothetical protein
MKNPTLEEKVDSYMKASGIIEEAEAQKAVIRDGILEDLNKMKVTGTKTANGYFVGKVTVISFSKVEMSTARELGAVKTEEKLDLKKLRQIHDKGGKIRGEEEFSYIKIKEATE